MVHSLVGSFLFRGPGIVASAAQDAQDDSVERAGGRAEEFFGTRGQTRAPMRSAFQVFFRKHSFSRAARSVLLGMTQLFGSATRKAGLDSMQKK